MDPKGKCMALEVLLQQSRECPYLHKGWPSSGFSVGPHPVSHSHSFDWITHEQKPLCSCLSVLRIPFYRLGTVISPAGSKLAYY